VQSIVPLLAAITAAISAVCGAAAIRYGSKTVEIDASRYPIDSTDLAQQALGLHALQFAQDQAEKPNLRIAKILSIAATVFSFAAALLALWTAIRA